MIQKAYKYRLFPTKEQEVLLAKHFGCSRWIYNYALDKKIKSYQQEKKSLSRFEIQKDLPALKKAEDTEWLKEVNSQTLQASLENLDKAFTKFFRDKKGFPKFKSKHNNRQSFSVPQNGVVDFETNTISLPKFQKPIKCKLHRKFNGKSKTVTVSKTPTGKYYVSVLVEVNEELPVLKPIDENKAVGIDLGIKTFAVLSNGDEIQNPRNLKKSLKKLKKLQRKVSKKVKGSKNRKKAVKKLAKMHEKVSNRRIDFLHKVTAKLVSENNTICLETLTASNMMKNHKLAQALSDISIGKFNEILEYKAKWNGVNILRIGRFQPSSKMCSCGEINKELKLSNRVWTCKACGVTHERDELAANNIKKFAFINLKNTAGIVGINACGDEAVALSGKQEAHSPLAWVGSSLLIISLFISCNSVNLAKYKSKNEAKSSFKVERNTTISETTLTKIKDYGKINFRLVEEKSSKKNTSEENNSISISEGEITKTDSQGNTTTIKGKGISTNNNSKSTISEEYLKREINLVKEQSQERLDSAVKKIDSTYKAKFESYVKQSEKQKEKKTTRFPIIIPIVIALALLVYAILKRHKII